MPKGDDFKNLPETHVIFITENDVMGRGLPLYHIDRYIRDTGEFFGDGSHILYVNGAYRDDSPIGRLMHDFSCSNPDEMYYDELADRARYFKESKEGISTMCKLLEDMRNEFLKEGLEKGREEGLKNGREEGVLATVRRMLDLGKYTLEDIADAAGLSLDEVKRLKAE